MNIKPPKVQMAKWTKWIRIAKGNQCDEGFLGYEGAACYELGIKVRNGREIVKVYVGRTSNEDRRIWGYASNGSHLYKRIDKVMEKGYALYYRAQAKKTVAQAKKLEKSLLRKRYYPWNSQLF